MIVRLLLEAAALIGTIALASRALKAFLPSQLRALIVIALALAVYVLLVRRLERRSAMELDPRKGSMQLPTGAAIGITMMTAVYGIFWAANIAAFEGVLDFEGFGAGVTAALLAAVPEELLFRAVLFRQLESAWGTTVALIVTAALFGLVHGLNPGATWFSDVAIALEAGLLLGVAYTLTRNLWFAIGIHAGWNFAEGSLFGGLVSGGGPTHSLIHATLTGPVIVTGADFGPEASIVSIGVCGTVAVLFAILTWRRGSWRKR